MPRAAPNQPALCCQSEFGTPNRKPGANTRNHFVSGNKLHPALFDVLHAGIDFGIPFGFDRCLVMTLVHHTHFTFTRA